ncbi:MarR family winged helix-turn-helix transcriptional regulator [Aurantiacibacter rhizosphaerae]|uniref:MarR family transcriptional regulator n=1 Tax=Aurantiacibacter rhizosphaerae TaxID=2691582 RepID=A0A844XF53_9SPHN|nr:MarR family transcriptional regulator [Aurantiacibacter rhizosphaerae]MWV28383.1 MarR family transcriptional regulator [Aurantiacibacter rhizosphaerae]
MHYDSIPPIGLGTLLRAVLVQLEPAVEAAYSKAVPQMRSRYYPVFRELLIRERAGVGDLARAIEVTQPAMTQTIDEMEKAGFITREPGEDRRSRLIALSAQGEAAASNLYPVWMAVAAAAKSLERDAGVALDDVLGNVLDALELKDFATRIEEAAHA